MTRTEAILAALTKEVEERRRMIDGAEDLGEVSLTVRLQAGTTLVRGVVWEEERVYRVSRRAGDRV